MFSIMQEPAPSIQQAESELIRMLEEISPDELTPRQALETLYTLRALAKKNDG